MLADKKILFIGAGSMAEAMISGLVQSEKISPKQIIVTNRTNEKRLSELESKYGVIGLTQNQLSLTEIDIFIFAMKPKDVAKAIETIKHHIQANQLILSVLAGIPTSYFEQILQNDQQVVRVMPNTSSMIGESATAISPGLHTTDEKIQLAKSLLECIGRIFIIDEQKMDVFTGIAGSGPAYFYYFMEYMEKEALKAGLEVENARQIIAQTIVGAAKMVQEREESPTLLRENVTSPNGTTAAGISALEEYQGGLAISKAVEHATKRSKEISVQIKDSILVSID